ncbi:MAG: ABC transporter ATP-binding protein [Mobilitalea sp.]
MRIKLDNVSKYYYSSNAVTPALRKIKLEFNIGEFVVITGESGSGKSTLLNIISGLDTYDDGELYIDGSITSDYDASDWEKYRKNKIGFVFQNYNLIEHYSVLANVESALLIQGYQLKEAKKTAITLIKKVGLEKQLNQKALRLSSGQKQRLSIARALAKNTDIIIADEPTGNLDSENGKQIMQLLSELSKDKLIITVTHNYEEAQPYATRKIRIHDGEVVSDILLQKAEEQAAIEEKEEHRNTTNSLQKLKSGSKIAARFSWMNIITQPGRVLYYLLFLLLTSAISFLFLGEIYANWDDTFAKEYNQDIFVNGDDTRIVVKKPDGSEITEADMNNFNNISHVVTADKYDYSNDINYFLEQGTDYIYNYESGDDSKKEERLRYFSPKKWNHYVKSSSCISAEDLSEGRLPKERNEIVLYGDESLLGSELLCYFESQNSWKHDQYYSTKVKIVGILKENVDQAYFSEELSQMLSLTMYGDSYSLAVSKNVLTGEYTDRISMIPVIGDDLKYGEVRLSSKYLSMNSKAVGEAFLTAYLGQDTYTRDTEVIDDFNSSTLHFIEINSDMFYEIYPHKSSQASIYMTDYIYTDKVLSKLEDMGYEAISSFRLGSVFYDNDKLRERNLTIIWGMLVLFIISTLEILIVRSIMKIRNKDFMILGSMGMENKIIKKINYFEMYLYTSVAVALVIIFANVLRVFEVDYLVRIIKYFNLFTYGIYIVLNFSVITFTVWLYNVYLKNRQKWK